MNLLGAKLYDPSVAVAKSTASLLAMTALDTTNLRLTVTVPAHGFLRIRMKGILTGATTFPTILLGVLNGASVVGRVAPVQSLGNTAVATADIAVEADFVVPGLTPGSITLDAAYAVQVVVASTNLKYGGPNDTTGNDAWGGFVFEIYDPQPIPTAAPGGSGGLLIAGSNAPTTFAGATSSPGLTITGGTTAAGALVLTGGSTSGDGLNVATTSGHGFNISATGTSKNGITATANTSGGAGAVFTGASGAAGISANGGSGSHGISAAGNGSGAGIQATAGTSGAGISATASGGNGITASSSGSNGVGIAASGNGTAPGIKATGGATGQGVLIVGGATSGDGLKITTTSGHGINSAPVGTSMHGILATGGNGGTSDGFKCVAGTGGVDIRGNLTGNLHGTLDTLTTYTNDTPQTGDSYARIGAAGIGLTNLGDTRIAHLDADVSSRLATSGYTAPPTTAAIATGVWQDTTGTDFTTAHSIGKALYIDNVPPGGDGGFVVGGATQTLNLKQFNVVNSTGDAVVFKSTNANSRAFYCWSTLGEGTHFQSDKNGGIGFNCTATGGGVSYGAQFSGNAYDIYGGLSGLFGFDLFGRVLGNASGNPIAGVGAQADVRTWLGHPVELSDTLQYPIVATAGVQTGVGDVPFEFEGSPSTILIGSSIAQLGDPMDLVDVPNPTAVTAIQSGLATASAVLAVKSDTAALVARPATSATVTITPLMAQISGNAGKDVTITAYVGSALPNLTVSVFDNTGASVPLSGTLKFVAYAPGSNGSLDATLFTVTGTYAGNQATFNIPATDIPPAGNYRWAAWEVGGTYGDQRIIGGDLPTLDSGSAP
jgi:hypothetical protein